MLEHLKEIKEKLNLLIEQVERYENALNGDEVIIEKKDFQFLKRVGRIAESESHLFQFRDGIFFKLYGIPTIDIMLEEILRLELKYEYSIFNALQQNRLPRIVLLKLKKPITTKNGSTITHKIEQEIDTKIREHYRGKK